MFWGTAILYCCSPDLFEQDWKYFMGLRNVSNDEQEQAAGKTTPWYARKQKAVIYKGLSMVGGSVISALAVS